MIDITKIFPEDSFTGPFACLILFSILVLMTRNIRKSDKGNHLILWLLCALFVEFAFWAGDYYHYANGIINMKYSTYDYMSKGSNQAHMETPYWFLAFFCEYNYLYFRLIIWCGSVLLLLLSCRLLPIKSSYFFYYFIPIALLSFSGSRLSLSESMALLGWFIFIHHCKYKFLFVFNLLLGASLLLIATYFHKSSYFFVAVLIISLIDVGIIRLRLLLVFLPVFAFLISTFVVPYLLGADVKEEGIVNYRSAQSYLDKGVVSYGIPTWISVILSFLTNGVIAWFLYQSVKNGEYKKWPVEIRKVANVVIYTFIFSVPFMFISETYTMFYRFIVFMLVPTVFLLAQLRQNGFFYKQTITIVSLSLISSFYSLGLSILGKLFSH